MVYGNVAMIAMILLLTAADFSEDSMPFNLLLSSLIEGVNRIPFLIISCKRSDPSDLRLSALLENIRANASSAIFVTVSSGIEVSSPH